MAIEPIGSSVRSTPQVTYTPAAEDAGRLANRASANAAHTPEDTSASTLSQLAAADLTRLSAMLEPNVNSANAAQVALLVRDASAAIAQGNTLQAIDSLSQVAALEPRTIEVLRSDPVFAPIRPEIDHLLSQLTSAARFDAQASLGRAEQLLDGGPLKTGFGMPPQAGALMQAAHRFFDAGGYANYVRSADLAQTIAENYSPWMINYSEPKPANVELLRREGLLVKRALQANIQSTWDSVRARAPQKVKRLWFRAPLLVLLLGWLALGLVVALTTVLVRGWSPDSMPASVTDAFYEFWGLGFLALVGLGFYARVRRPRY